MRKPIDKHDFMDAVLNQGMWWRYSSIKLQARHYNWAGRPEKVHSDGSKELEGTGFPIDISTGVVAWSDIDLLEPNEWPPVKKKAVLDTIDLPLEWLGVVGLASARILQVAPGHPLACLWATHLPAAEFEKDGAVYRFDYFEWHHNLRRFNAATPLEIDGKPYWPVKAIFRKVR